MQHIAFNLYLNDFQMFASLKNFYLPVKPAFLFDYFKSKKELF